MKVLVKTPLSPYSGYGNDGIGLASELVKWGADVYLQPSHVDPPLPPLIAHLLTKRLEAPFDLILQHMDPLQLGVEDEVRAVADMVVGWTMWEWTNFDRVPEGDPNLQTWDNRYGSLDCVLCYDDNTQDAILQQVPGTASVVCQGGYDPHGWEYVSRDWASERFGFCMVGALHERKSPFTAIKAFRHLKETRPEFEGAELHLKTVTPGLHHKLEEVIPKLRIHYATWPASLLKAFYGEQHCLLAPSRGEGKNMPALEFMSTGGAVIATNWGGHTQWLADSYAYPLRYTLAGEAGHPRCLSAVPDQDHLEELMWSVYTNRSEAKRRGELASRTIPRMCSWETVVERMFLKLRDAVPGRGERLYEHAMFCRRSAPLSQHMVELAR